MLIYSLVFIQVWQLCTNQFVVNFSNSCPLTKFIPSVHFKWCLLQTVVKRLIFSLNQANFKALYFSACTHFKFSKCFLLKEIFAVIKDRLRVWLSVQIWNSSYHAVVIKVWFYGAYSKGWKDTGLLSLSLYFLNARVKKRYSCICCYTLMFCLIQFYLNSTTFDLKLDLKELNVHVHIIKIYIYDCRFAGHATGVNDVSFSPAGNLMASCSQDGSLAIWIPSITGESTFWKGHTAAVRSIAFTPDGKQLISASDDKTIKLWTVNKSR